MCTPSLRPGRCRSAWSSPPPNQPASSYKDIRHGAPIVQLFFKYIFKWAFSYSYLTTILRTGSGLELIELHWRTLTSLFDLPQLKRPSANIEILSH